MYRVWISVCVPWKRTTWFVLLGGGMTETHTEHRSHHPWLSWSSFCVCILACSHDTGTSYVFNWFLKKYTHIWPSSLSASEKTWKQILNKYIKKAMGDHLTFACSHWFQEKPFWVVTYYMTPISANMLQVPVGHSRFSQARAQSVVWQVHLLRATSVLNLEPAWGAISGSWVLALLKPS